MSGWPPGGEAYDVEPVADRMPASVILPPGRCGCQRYPTAPCIEKTPDLLCPQCAEARCVVVEFLEASVAHCEHVSADDLIIDPFGPGAIQADS